MNALLLTALPLSVGPGPTEPVCFRPRVVCRAAPPCRPSVPPRGAVECQYLDLLAPPVVVAPPVAPVAGSRLPPVAGGGAGLADAAVGPTGSEDSSGLLPGGGGGVGGFRLGPPGAGFVPDGSAEVPPPAVRVVVPAPPGELGPVARPQVDLPPPGPDHQTVTPGWTRRRPLRPWSRSRRGGFWRRSGSRRRGPGGGRSGDRPRGRVGGGLGAVGPHGLGGLRMSHGYARPLYELDVFSSGQAARLCRVAPRTVSKWFDSGRLKGYRIPGSSDRRIPREQLIAFMKEHGIPLRELEPPPRGVLLVGCPAGVADRLAGAGCQVAVAADLFEAGRLAASLKPLSVVIGAEFGRTASRRAAEALRRTPGLDPLYVIGLLGPDEPAGDPGPFDAVFPDPADPGAVAAAVLGRVGGEQLGV